MGAADGVRSGIADRGSAGPATLSSNGKSHLVVKRAPVWHLSNGVFDHAARWACFDSAGLGGTEWRRRLLRPRPRFSPLEQRNTCQQYSPENQLEVIRQYARSRNMEIAQVYSDHGRSGLNIAGRRGLQSLDVRCGTRARRCSAPLAYNVSRW
jgi:hypothetical protein